MHRYTSWACLLLVASSSLGAVSAQNKLCDPTKPNDGCDATYGYCDKLVQTCYCYNGFVGDGQTCESSCESSTQTCQEDMSSCIDIPYEYPNSACLCEPGYYWSFSEGICRDRNECSEAGSCVDYSGCTNSEGSYSCQCCYKNSPWNDVPGFGYVGDGNSKCYAEAIIHYGDSSEPKTLTEPGYIHTTLAGGLPYFGQLHWDIYVHTNGLITFDTPNAPYLGGSAFPTRRDVVFVAPFWTDLVASGSDGSGLYLDQYSDYETEDGKVFSKVEKFVPHLRDWLDDIDLSGFNPTQVIVATWKDMMAPSFSEGNHVTFQAVLLSNGTHSFGFTSYDEQTSTWALPMDNVYIGFFSQNEATRRPFGNFQELFQNAPFSENMCDEMTFLTLRGRWYKVFGEPFAVLNRNPVCLKEASRQALILPHLSGDTPSNMPRDYYCPCFEEQASADSRFSHIMLEDRNLCYISKFYNKPVEGFSKVRSYCCYDPKGALILKGPNTGGMVPDGFEDDMKMLKRECCFLSDLCDVFQYMYPPVNCHQYPRPGLAYVRGAGHFNSFNGSAYTFNGHGEYTYFWLKGRSVEAQIRMENKTYESTGQVTSFITAVAAKCPTDMGSVTVELRINSTSNYFEGLIDGNYVEINDDPTETGSALTYCRRNKCYVGCGLPRELYSMEISLVNGEYFEIDLTSSVVDEQPFGIVGYFDGTLHGGDMTVDDFEDADQITTFAETNRISAEEFSLFTHNRGETFEDYNDMDFMPSLWVDVKELIDESTTDQIQHCSGDYACQYDQLVTGDMDISKATHEGKADIDEDRNVMATKTSQWEAGPYINISIHENFEGTLMDLVMYDEDNIGTENPTTNPADGFDLDTEIPDDLYDFDNKTGDYVLKTTKNWIYWRTEKSYVNIYAYKNGPDGVVSRSKYSPNIFICACNETSQCDFSFIERTALDRATNVYSYYPLPCNCPANVKDRFCADDFDICDSRTPCDAHATCHNDATAMSGYTCTCNEGYSGNGMICTINDCPDDNNCADNCHLDPNTLDPVCTCNDGYVTDDGGVSCFDRNECNYPAMCSDENSYCVNTVGSYYCECETGYKPMTSIEGLRVGCEKASYTYSGSITFAEYFDIGKTQMWKGWDDSLADHYMSSTQATARQLEPLMDEFIKLIVPEIVAPDGSNDLGTYIMAFSKTDSGDIMISFKFYPDVEFDETAATTKMRGYITQRSGEAAGLKGIASDSVTLMKMETEDYCASGCSMFATCQNSETDKVCTCYPGFAALTIDVIGIPAGTCKSHCALEPCSSETAHSCRDSSQFGRQCLCKPGYELVADNTCHKIKVCQPELNVCGDNANCHDNGDGTHECVCKEGFLQALRPAPDACVPDVILFRDSMDNMDLPTSVDFDDSFDNSIKVAIPVGFPYGHDSKQWKIYVGPNGIISMGKNITADEIRSHHPSKYGYLIAPLWGDFVWNKDNITVNIYDSTTSTKTPEWQTAIDTIRNVTRIAAASYPPFNMFGFSTLNSEDIQNFEAKTILVVTWKDLMLQPFPDKDRVTMQVVIASDGLRTFVMFNYDPSTTSINTWEDPTFENDEEKAYPHRGFSGFQAGNRQFCLNRATFGESQTDCRDFYPNMLMESKLGLYPGRHMFMVYNTDETEAGTSGERQCFDSLSDYMKRYHEHQELTIIEREIDDTHPASCPWTETMVKEDERFAYINDRNMDCYMRRFWTAMPYGSEGKSVNLTSLCCYHSNAIVRNFTHMIIDYDKFADLQGDILKSCCRFSAHCELTRLVIPPEYVMDGYEPPATGGVYGDPHLQTFFGQRVTFKGIGDYVLFTSSELEVQGRFDKLNVSSEGAGAKAIAWKLGDSSVVAEVDETKGVMFTLNGVEVDLTQPPYPGLGHQENEEFRTSGHIESNVEEGKVTAVAMTYTNGMSFVVNLMMSESDDLYLHARIRIPRAGQLRDEGRGLMADFFYPNGTEFRPTISGNLPVFDKNYFHYGKAWSVQDTAADSLFPTPMPPTDYTPPFFEDLLTASPGDTPLLDECNGDMQCAYDYNVTGDRSIAMATLQATNELQSLYMAEGERPPEFVTLGKSVWAINVATDNYVVSFLPEIKVPNPDTIRFHYDTNFPSDLYVLEPISGLVQILVTPEVRDTFLNKGPFYFYVVATNGKTGAAAYSPIAVRVCNCLDSRSCDFSDELDSQEVGIIPTEVYHYSIARCNCYSYQTGKFCNESYSACSTHPCWNDLFCTSRMTSDLLKPSFSCADCPEGYDTVGLNCVKKDPCQGVTCAEGTTCQNIGDIAKCLCPDGEAPGADGECQYLNRCEQQPAVCVGDGKRCNSAPMGQYWCDCMPGFAPRYDKVAPGLELESCQRIKYTYAGSVEFGQYYNVSKELVGYSKGLASPESMEYQQFARRVLTDLENAASLLTKDIVGAYIRSVKATSANGFSLDYYTYSNVEFTDTAAINGMIQAYFSETGNVGVVVNINTASTTYADICNTAYSPCDEIKEIAACSQNGIAGEGPVCTCSMDLGYETHHLDAFNDAYKCIDVCENICKEHDPMSTCHRESPTSAYTCPCVSGYVPNTDTGMCQVAPTPECTPACGPNAQCIPIDQNTAECQCLPGFSLDDTNACISNCEKLGQPCSSVDNAYGCNSLDAGYECLCDAGFEWDGSSKCADLNECKENTFTCPEHSQCNNIPGGYNCLCDADFEAGANNNTCFVLKESMLYPYNMEKQGPIRDANYVQKFNVRTGFQYGQSYIHTVHVGFDGFVGLDAPPPYRYIGMALDHHIVAPFWADLDFDPDDSMSGLYIDSFDAYYDKNKTEDWQKSFDLALQHLQTQYPEVDNPNLHVDETVPMAMLILTWVKVTPAPASDYAGHHATFQAILCANNGFSFFVFNYLNNPADNQWPSYTDAPTLQPYIGYTIGSHDIIYQSLNGEPAKFDNVFEKKNNPQLPGRIVHALDLPVNQQSRECLVLYNNFEKEVWNTIKVLNVEGSGVEDHSACPAFLKQIELDSRWLPAYDIYGAVCYSGTFWNEGKDPAKPDVTYHVRSICCYEMNSGSFLGYPRNDHHINSFLEVKEYRDQQKALFNACCRFSPYCELFAMAHNPSQVTSPEYYDQPVMASVRGDPHLGMPLHDGESTFRELTFNGKGEYTLFQSLDSEYGDITVQIRFTIREVLTKKATFTTGIAIQAAKGDVIEILENKGDRAVYRNGTWVNLVTLPPIFDAADSADYELWATDDEIGYTTSTGLAFHVYHVDSSYFNIRMSLPRSVSSHIMIKGCGLLGSFDSPPYQDCDGNNANGDIWNDDKEAYDFGQRFKVANKEESLFTYKEGPNFNEINEVDPDWVPFFTDEAPCPANVTDVCGEDKACRYDYCVTHDTGTARDTMQFGKMLKDAALYESEESIRITNDYYLIMHAADFTIPGVTYPIDVNCTDEGADGVSYEAISNVESSRYTFDSVTGEFSIVSSNDLRDYVRTLSEPPYVRFVAHRGFAADIWVPSVSTCACEKSDQCDWEYVAIQYVPDREKTPTHNYFVPCKCPPTARGKFCEGDFDPCSESPCGQDVECHKDETNAMGFTCGTCPEGYNEVDGVCKLKVCPVDYCTDGVCHVSVEDGSFSCQCASGFELSATNSRVCDDVDECMLETHDCFKYGAGFKCTNTPGSYACGCRTGYAPDNTTNFQTCEKVPNQLLATLEVETVIVNGKAYGWSSDLADKASQTYKDVAESLQESLLKWYIEDLDQKSVTSVIVNALSPGSTRAESETIVSDYSANSDNALVADDIEKAQKDFLADNEISGVKGAKADSVKVTSDPCKTSENNCDTTSTTCSYNTAEALLTCDCNSGYAPITGADRTCVDDCANLCTTQLGSNGECDRTSATDYTCKCKTGFYESAGTCKSACDPNPCNGGTCAVVSGSTYLCQCRDNFDPSKDCASCMSGYEDNGSGSCISKCEGETCNSHGTCILNGGNAECKCDEGYGGSNCDTAISTGECATNICKNDGTCFLNNGVEECKCTSDYTGSTCEDKLIDSSAETLTIVGAVLGSVCFILLCVVLGFACLLSKKNSKQGSQDHEMYPRRSSSSSDDSIPRIDIRQPVKAETAFSTSVAPTAPPKAMSVHQAQESHYVQQAATTIVASAAPHRASSSSSSSSSSSGSSRDVYAPSVEPQIKQSIVAPTAVAPVLLSPPVAMTQSISSIYGDVDEESEEF